MTIHPPIVFVGYAFILLAVALAFARIGVDVENDDALLGLSLQIAWFFLTLGIALGGLWAYTVLGWGGYWYWDPVETASLMTWLALTAYFHLNPLARTEKGITKEFMILLTFEALIFLSALTRGGFRQSVHAYALSPAGPFLLLFGFAIAAYFFHLKRKSGLPIWSVEVNKASLRSVSLFAGFASLMAILTVCFIGIIFPIVANALAGTTVTTGVDFYNVWSFPFVTAFVVSLIGCNVPAKFGFKKFVVLIVGLIINGILFAVIGFPTGNALANSGLPFLVVGLLSSAYTMIRTLKVKGKNFRLFGRKLVHLGVIITLIGVLVSAGAKQSSVFENAVPNTTLETLELRVKLGNFTVYSGTGRVYAEQLDVVTAEYTSLRLDIEVLQNEKMYKGVIWSYLYINYGIVSNPLVIATEKGDIYLHLGITQSMSDALRQSFMGELAIPEDLTITVEKIPLVYLVWIGIAMLCIGIVLSFGRPTNNTGYGAR
jgi:cytochrome c-type biogenesis protein CcmF